MSSAAPRPILKSCGQYRTNNHPPEHHRNGVHFPPPISLSRTFDTHSSTIYDRSPIMVTPNSCALPERGCPGRTYHALEEPASSSYFSLTSQASARDHAHPRAFARHSSLSPGYTAVPPLIPDLSSESEESDGFSNYPPDLQTSFRPTPSPPRYPSSYNNACSYSPTRPSYPAPMNSSYLVPVAQPNNSYSYSPPREKSRRRKESQYRELDYRIRNSSEVAADDPGYDDDADIATPLSGSPDREKKKKSHRKSSSSMASLCKTFSGFGMQDDAAGCLGGF